MHTPDSVIGDRMIPLSIVVILTAMWSSPALAAEENVTLSFRPHCEEAFGAEAEKRDLFPLPDNPEFIEIGSGKQTCGFFDSEDPLTLRTPALSVGDVLDFDVYVENPSKQALSLIKAALIYDPNVLKGESIKVSPLFPSVYPGESDFLSAAGTVKIGAAAEEGKEPTLYGIAFARVRMTVMKAVPNGKTVISFSDVQPGGGTQVTSGAPDEAYVIGEEPGSLLVTINSEAASSDPKADGADCTSNEQCASGACVEGVCGELKNAADEGPCQTDDECDSFICYENICRASGFTIPNGGACRRDNQCLSLLCRDGICAPAENLAAGESCAANEECISNVCENGACKDAALNGSSSESSSLASEGTQASSADSSSSQSAQSSDAQKKANGETCADDAECGSNTCIAGYCRSPNGDIPTGQPCELSFQCQSGLCVSGMCADRSGDGERTAFGLLQILNLQVTSESDTALLSWDELPSAELKGYNIYYGKTPGSYIQRKGVTAEQFTQGERPSLVIPNLEVSERYYFAVRAVSNRDEESAFSEEQSVVIGKPNTSTSPLVATIITGSSASSAAPTNPIREDANIPALPGETGLSTTLLLTLLLAGSIAGTVIASRKSGSVILSSKS